MATPPPTPRLPLSERLRRAGIASWSIIGILIVAAIAGWALLKIRIIFPPLVLALLIIYLLNPIVARLEARRVPRVWGTLLSYVVVLGSVTLIIIAITPLISNQVQDFADDWPEFRVEIVSFVDDAAQSIEDRFGTRIDTTQFSCLLGVEGEEVTDAPSQAQCDEVTHDLRERITGSAGRITELGFDVLEGLLTFILAPLLALYLLIDLPQLQRDLLNLVPEKSRDEVSDLGTKVGKTVGGFFRGQLLVALIVGVLASLGFAVVGLKFWLVIGAIAGFTNLIPLVGPFIGGGLGFIVGTITDGIGTGLKVIVVAVIVQQIDNHVISPNVMKRTVQLHPVTVMLSLLAGGALAGFWGVLLGVPTVAVAKVLSSHLWTTRVLHLPASPATEPIVGRRPPADNP
ncbi:MAG: AI-2E family transporter, partial [Actinomycetota bacterium]|nr:AI-2E family transporter [Actinomycetota bacterium]